MVICHESGELDDYISLKLRIANATHTASVYSMALSGLIGTSSFVKHADYQKLIDSIFWRDIYPTISSNLKHYASQFFNEWINRLQHPYFELGTYFICQNAIQKLSMLIFALYQRFCSTDL